MPQLSPTPVLGSHTIEPTADVRAAQVLHLPTPMLHDMQRIAGLMGRDVSSCAQMAWSIGGMKAHAEATLELADHSPLMTGRKVPASLSLNMRTWLDLTLEAERRDRSRSWMMQRAWLAARDRILADL